MTTPVKADSRVDGFLATLRVALRGMPEREIDEILREIRSHVTELSETEGGDVESAIRSLGDPVDLARTYRTERLVIQAECSGSPLVILQALRHASRTRAGRFTATLLYVFGYANVVALGGAAVEKLLAPARTGLWYVPGDAWPLALVADGAAPPGGRELLGWWLVPAALVAGWALKYVADRVAKAWLRRRRQATDWRTP